MPISLLGMCAAIASTGTRERWASNSPLIRCRFPGPQLAAHTASSPVTAASPAAANAAASSCRTCSHASSVAAQRVGEAVQRVAGEPVDTADAGPLQRLDDQIRDGERHRPDDRAPAAPDRTRETPWSRRRASARRRQWTRRCISQPPPSEGAVQTAGVAGRRRPQPSRTLRLPDEPIRAQSAQCA